MVRKATGNWKGGKRRVNCIVCGELGKRFFHPGVVCRMEKKYRCPLCAANEVNRIKRLSELAKRRGFGGWNKGLTKDTSDILKHAGLKSGNTRRGMKQWWSWKLRKPKPPRSEEHKRKLREVAVSTWKDEGLREAARERAIHRIINGDLKKSNTSGEMKVRKILIDKGIEFEQQYRVSKVVCDFYLPRYALVIEVDGDYWHANPKKYSFENLSEMQKRNLQYRWMKRTILKKEGLGIIEIFESEIDRLIDILKSNGVEVG